MRTGTATTTSPSRGNSPASRFLAVAAALGLTFAVAGCGEGVSDASGFAAEDGQTAQTAEEDAPLAASETSEEEGTVTSARNDKSSEQRAAPDGQPLMAASGQPLGEVDNLVIDKQSAQLFAVVAVDDAVPADVSVVAIPLQQMQLEQDQLRVGPSPQQITTDMAYTQGQYQPIELGVPLREYEVVSGT